MKKIIAATIAFLLAVSLTACGGNEDTTDSANATDSAVVTDEHGHDASDGHTHTHEETEPTTLPENAPKESVIDIKETFDEDDYNAYYDLFYNKNTENEGKTLTKTGVFAAIRDQYNEKTRYYVWGYKDENRAECWQWEFVPSDENTLPDCGSVVEMTGVLTASDDSLDGYWFTDTKLTVKEEFKSDYDFDLAAMSPTLGRVQIANMQQKSDYFKGKTVRVFGRALNSNCVQHPYYDNTWNLDFQFDGTLPETGDYVIITGVFNVDDNGGTYVQADKCEIL